MVISVWVTDLCNMQCPYCYTNRDNSNEMNNGMQEKILEFIDYKMKQYPSDTLSIKFFGGEPLLKFEFIKEFTKKISSVKDKWIDNPIGLLITTNGTMLTNEVVDFLEEYKFSVSLSIDGIPKIHDKSRLIGGDKPSWHIIEKKIPYLLEKIPNAFARMTYTSETVEYLHESVDFLINIGFKKIKPIPDYFDENWTEERFEIQKKEFDKIISDYENKYSKDPSLEIMFLKEKMVKRKYTGCGGGVNSFSIDSRGDVYPCTYVVKNKDFCLGNINNIPSVTVPQYSSYKKDRTACNGCRYYNCCESSRCVFANYKMTGAMDTPNGFYCNHQKLLFDIDDYLNK